MAVRLAESEERERHFLMSVSHELRTPLTAIKGHVDALRDGLVDDPELMQASLDVVAAEADSARAARRRRPRPREARAHRFTVLTEEVDMGRLVEQAYTSFAEEARRREIDYRLRRERRGADDHDRRRPRAPGDHEPALERAALDAGRRGASRSASTPSNGTVSVDVADSGPGITREQQDRIFRPFVSGDTQGTGLGLPIARELARALGGASSSNSTVGAGQPLPARLPARSV